LHLGEQNQNECGVWLVRAQLGCFALSQASKDSRQGQARLFFPDRLQFFQGIPKQLPLQSLKFHLLLPSIFQMLQNRGKFNLSPFQ